MPFFEINNLKLYYETYGKGTSIVFLPGLGCCCKAWKPQVDFFARKYHVIVFDLRGHGHSQSGEENFTMNIFAGDLKGLLDLLKVNSVILCGLSLGSLAAQQFIKNYPESCRGLILCGSHSHPGIKEKIVGRLVPSALKKYFKTKTLQEFARATAKKVFSKPDQEQIRDFYASEVISTTVDGYLKSWEAVRQFDSLHYLKTIQVPTLIYHGANDDSFIRKQALLFLKQIKNSKHEIMHDAYHIINLERPDEFNRNVWNFIEEYELDKK